MFDGGKLEHQVMEKSGCLNYTATAWEPFKDDVLERRLSYRFNRHVSVFGGEVTCTQQKSPINADHGQGWIVNEVMALHGVPFSDHFRVCIPFEILFSILHISECQIHIRLKKYIYSSLMGFNECSMIQTDTILIVLISCFV